jgi:hypothetical protein
MIDESEIRDRLAALLLSRAFASDLEDFEDWLVQRSWNMHRDSGPAAQELAAAIELALAEHSSNHLSPEELRRELLRLMDVNAFALDSIRRESG